jgi:hypothetical protein
VSFAWGNHAAAGRDTMELLKAMLKTAAQMSARVFVLPVEAEVVADVQAYAIELEGPLEPGERSQRARLTAATTRIRAAVVSEPPGSRRLR